MTNHLLRGSVLMLSALAANATSIYTCVDKQGRKHTADRPIAACSGQEHRVLNADGSLQRIVPAALSPRERIETERREREAAREQQAREEAVKRDRLLLRRYPTEAVHRAARSEALRPVDAAVEATRRRLGELEQARKPLEVQAASLGSAAVPSELKNKLNANDAMVNAQRALMQQQASEISRINAVFDKEAERLQPMWKSGR